MSAGLIACAGFLMWTVGASALGLGALQTTSAAGEVFHGLIPVTQSSGIPTDALQFAVIHNAPNGDKTRPMPADLDGVLVSHHKQLYVQVTSEDPIQSNALSFTVMIMSPDGIVMQDYTASLALGTHGEDPTSAGEDEDLDADTGSIDPDTDGESAAGAEIPLADATKARPPAKEENSDQTVQGVRPVPAGTPQSAPVEVVGDLTFQHGPRSRRVSLEDAPLQVWTTAGVLVLLGLGSLGVRAMRHRARRRIPPVSPQDNPDTDGDWSAAMAVLFPEAPPAYGTLSEKARAVVERDDLPMLLGQAREALASGQRAEAVSLLGRAIALPQGVLSLRLRLAETLYRAGMGDAFVIQARALKPAVPDIAWVRLCAMGRALCPDEPLFAPGSPSEAGSAASSPQRLQVSAVPMTQHPDDRREAVSTAPVYRLLHASTSPHQKTVEVIPHVSALDESTPVNVRDDPPPDTHLSGGPASNYGRLPWLVAESGEPATVAPVVAPVEPTEQRPPETVPPSIPLPLPVSLEDEELPEPEPVKAGVECRPAASLSMEPSSLEASGDDTGGELETAGTGGGDETESVPPPGDGTPCADPEPLPGTTDESARVKDEPESFDFDAALAALEATAQGAGAQRARRRSFPVEGRAPEAPNLPVSIGQDVPRLDLLMLQSCIDAGDEAGARALLNRLLTTEESVQRIRRPSRPARRAFLPRA